MPGLSFRKICIWVAVAAVKIALFSLIAGHARAADEVSALLQDADRYRTDAENQQVETEVTVLGRDGSIDKERRYTVFVQAGRQSLVLMRSPAEAGQKVLMLGDDFWMLLPGSQRPMRITPTQKLLGEASTGDIATMSCSQDYSGQVVGEERCEAEALPGAAPSKPCLHLTLNAIRKGVSYARIELWIGKARHEPVRADLYVQSDKLAKQARFVMDKPSAPTRVDAMVLLDQLGTHKETRVSYASRRPRKVPETWLNPMFLARNPALD